MITNPDSLRTLREAWTGVRQLRSKIQAALLSSATDPGSFVIFVADAAHNLPFLHACAVLNEVLLQFREENHFTSDSGTRTLGALIKKSLGEIPWVNFDLVIEAVERRNDMAHRAEVLPRAVCWKYIDAIEGELVNWGIVEAT